jgi:hypothetical protein
MVATMVRFLRICTDNDKEGMLIYGRNTWDKTGSVNT